MNVLSVVRSSRKQAPLVATAFLLLGAVLFPAPVVAQGALSDGRAALRAGRYDDAISAFTVASGGASPSPDAMRLLLRTYMEVGRFEDAERVAARYAESPSASVVVANVVGELLVKRGLLAEAEASFREAVNSRATDSLSALLNLAILDFDRGQRASAMQQFDHFIDVWNRGGNLSADDFMAIAVACRYLGLDDPVLFKDALKAFDRAIATDTMNLEARVRVGELFMEKYNSPDAQASFDDVLRANPRHPRALLGVARRRLADNQGGADSLITLALATNPNFAAAHELRAELRLGAEDYAGALQAAQAALAVDSGSPAALSIVSAIHFMKGETAQHEAMNARVLERNPRYATLFVTLARLSAQNRLYSQAADFARRAIALDDHSWEAHSELGVNLLRTGFIQEGRAALETTFAGDPYNVLVKNTLDLLDTFKDYDEIDAGKFRLMIGKQESALIALYASSLLERAYDSLSTRFGYAPEGPIRVEFYRRHADFSVRTVGLTGIGALGVSFGNVLAMDSPVGRETGPFNWGSVLWHELGHTFTLGMTNHRVPRWLSEGLSVYQERKSGFPGWGADVTATFLRAFKADILSPVSSLNDGFMRPRYSDHLIHSYYQASLVCEMIETQFGEKALLAMLHGYRDGLTPDAVLKAAVNMTPAQIDERFKEYVRTRFRSQLEAVGSAQVVAVERGGAQTTTQVADSGAFDKAMLAGINAREAGNVDQAVQHFQRAITLFPEYAGDASPYVQLAVIFADRGDDKAAADMLGRHNAINENAYDQHIAEALFREAIEDYAGAARVLDRAMYIYPYDLKVHERLAELATRITDHKLAVRERRAVVALNPVDLAEAQYQLALALHMAGENTAARSEVLRALEHAPNFEKAQDLLLKIRGGDDSTGKEFE